RIPSLSSVRTRSMCCFLVSSFLTEITQQIHSLRASGVMSSHFASASASEMRTFRKSPGTACTAPSEIAFVVTDFSLPPMAVALVCMSTTGTCEFWVGTRGSGRSTGGGSRWVNARGARPNTMLHCSRTDMGPDRPLAYLITFRCYGTWLHGDERGSTDRHRNQYGTPFIPSNEYWHTYNAR